MDSNDVKVTVEQAGGWLWAIVFWFVLWATCFGVTYNGKHYQTHCTCNRGVALEEQAVSL